MGFRFMLPFMSHDSSEEENSFVTVSLSLSIFFSTRLTGEICMAISPLILSINAGALFMVFFFNMGTK